MAGRAEPGAEVTLRDGEHEIGHVRADRRGEFVLIPDQKLAAGGRELSLTARDQGGHEVTSDEKVVVVVPAPKQEAGGAQPAPSSALAMLVPPAGQAPRMLQAPRAPDRNQKLSLNTVDYDEKGDIRVLRLRAAVHALRVYVDNQPVGEAKTDAQGQWSLTPQQSVATGVHQFRVDQLGQTGRVASRVELPFQRTVVAPPGNDCSPAAWWSSRGRTSGVSPATPMARAFATPSSTWRTASRSAIPG